MTETNNIGTEQPSDVFAWHPDYAGKSFDSVLRELTDDIIRDQRAYHAALDQAEKEEFGAFNSVRELEKRWSRFDFGWFDVPAETLANRILAFERARDERNELIAWDDWRLESTTQTGDKTLSEQKPDWRENLTDEQRKRIASGASILIILLMIVACVLIYMLIR